MKKFSRIYIEITNNCNLSCSFCVGNVRPTGFMEIEKFRYILRQAKEFTDYIYLHVLGEPLLHPQLADVLQVAEEGGMKVNITTNGTLLMERADILLSAPALRKISVSLHSMEADSIHFGKAYLKEVAQFANLAQEKGILCEFRMWNLGVEGKENEEMFSILCDHLGIGGEIRKEMLATIAQKGSSTLKKGVFLGKAERFQWPTMEAPEQTGSMFCYGLRNQAAILWEGTVVPCCFDSVGDVNLGNIFVTPLAEILQGERATALYEGFSKREAREALCRRCGYATRFQGK